MDAWSNDPDRTTRRETPSVPPPTLRSLVAEARRQEPREVQLAASPRKVRGRHNTETSRESRRGA
jgi:hypothetical protein